MSSISTSESSWLPMKFGGTSLAGAGQWGCIASLVDARLAAGYKPVLVCSAVAGVTDALKQLADAPCADARQAAADRVLALNQALGGSLGLDMRELNDAFSGELEQHVKSGMAATDFAAQAQILALGELMSSRIGAAWLASKGYDVAWQDAREALVSRPEPERKRRQFLDARCAVTADADLQARWSGAGVVVTQGFLARNTSGQTVLLGRGGSDTSAAYFGAALQAGGVEIWSDVPGMFSTDPRMIPAARLLRELDHFEALEIAVAGAAVIHPQCIRVAREAGLEIKLGQLGSSGFPGTVISDRGATGDAIVKAVSLRRDMVTLLLENQDMRQAVGFLARVFTLFAEHGISLDQVATSETTTTVSLDLRSNHIDLAFVEGLAEELKDDCDVQILAPSACISLVGRGIRKVLAGISQSMKTFESGELWLASYSANDLAYTLVVPEAAAVALVQTLHAELIEKNAGLCERQFGPEWNQLHSVAANA